MLERVSGPDLEATDLRMMADRFLDDGERAELERHGDVTTSRLERDGPIRIHATRTADGIALSLRFLSQSIPTLADLSLPDVVERMIRRPFGLVIVGGPTGSGKSTTLAALVNTINASSAKKIITIEDPIEYRIRSQRSLVVQRQVGRDVESFSRAILGALRSDPNVLVVGEMRDCATITAAVMAAETGHLVLSTLHTGDAAQAVDRLIDAFPAESVQSARSRIARVLIGCISQRLVELASGRGRCVAAEVLVSCDAVQHMIREGKQHQLANAIATGRRFGMQTLEGHLADLVSSGMISQLAPLDDA